MTESKRRRVNPSPLDNSRSVTSVRVVCQNGPDILRLPHIVAKLDEFLDNSGKWTLPNACASDSPQLVERVLVRQEAESSTSFWYLTDYRQRQFDESLENAVNVGNLKIVQLLGMHFQGCLSWQVIGNAAGRGRSEIVKSLIECGCDVEWNTAVVHEAIKNGHFELVKWLKVKLPSVSPNKMSAWAQIAASKGDLEMVKWTATDYGKLNVLQWILDEPNRNVLLYELCHEPEGNPTIKIRVVAAPVYGHTGVLTWLIQHHPELCNGDSADINAARNGHLDILRLLLSSPIATGSSLGVINYAAEQGYLDIVKYLVSKGYSVDHAMDDAAMNGFLDIVKWLHGNTAQNCTNVCTTKALDGAASNGHLDVVKWLHHKRVEGCTVLAMDNAAGHGYFRVIQWLHENRTEGCTVKTMDGAASRGNLEMVKWLHSNRSEGCTTSAMDSAAGNGHLDVVKWLHTNRSESCTASAMDLAALNNHLDVLKWLDENKTEGFTSAAITNAGRKGNLKVLQWLFSRRLELCTSTVDRVELRALYVATLGGHFDVVWYLHHNCRECGSIEVLKKTLTSVILSSYNLFRFADWAYIHHPHEFKQNIAEHLFAD